MSESPVLDPRALVEPLTEEQIAALPLYEWDVARVGDAAPPFTFAVTEASIARYCAAVRNENPLYLDPAAARQGPFGGIVAPPTFAFMAAPLRRNELMHARGRASPEEKGDRATPYAKAELSFHRPIRPGDAVVSVVRLAEKYERRGSQFITFQVEATVDGAPVVAYSYTVIWRQAPRDPNAPRPAAAPAVAAAAVSAEDEIPPIVKAETQAAIDQYAELTRVRPRRGKNLHTDPSFAQRTIFGGTVNMGVATAAYCAEAIERALGPAGLLRAGARLEYKGIRPIRAGDEVTIGGRVTARRAGAADCEVSVVAADGTLRGIATATVVVD